jgi:hypothetical protein
MMQTSTLVSLVKFCFSLSLCLEPERAFRASARFGETPNRSRQCVRYSRRKSNAINGRIVRHLGRRIEKMFAQFQFQSAALLPLFNGSLARSAASPAGVIR